MMIGKYPQLGMYVMAILLVLTGCATTGASTRTRGPALAMPDSEAIMAILGVAKEEVEFLNVPAANNAISLKMQLAALAMGSGSTAVDALTARLMASPAKATGVAGVNQALNVATVRATLEGLKGKQVGGTVYLRADEKSGQELVGLGEALGVKVVIVK